LLAISVVFGFSACDTGNSGSSKNSEAELTEITIGGVKAESIPKAITGSEWDDENTSLVNAETVTMPYTLESDMTDAVIVLKVSKGAKVTLAPAASTNTRPDPEAFVSAAKGTFVKNQFAYVKVTSEDGKNVNYYRFRFTVKNSNPALSSATIGGVTVSGGDMGTPAEEYTAAGAGKVVLTKTQSQNAAITVVKAVQGTTVQYAVAKGAAAPEFGDTATFNLDDTDFIYLKATAENEVNVNIYKI
jgi:hypothetical protein